MYSNYGITVRKEWPVGRRVTFAPKGFVGGKELEGVITGHLYKNLLLIDTSVSQWQISTYRCTLLPDDITEKAHNSSIWVNCLIEFPSSEGKYKIRINGQEKVIYFDCSQIHKNIWIGTGVEWWKE